MSGSGREQRRPAALRRSAAPTWAKSVPPQYSSSPPVHSLAGAAAAAACAMLAGRSAAWAATLQSSRLPPRSDRRRAGFAGAGRHSATGVCQRVIPHTAVELMMGVHLVMQVSRHAVGDVFLVATGWLHAAIDWWRSAGPIKLDLHDCRCTCVPQRESPYEQRAIFPAPVHAHVTAPCFRYSPLGVGAALMHCQCFMPCDVPTHVCAVWHVQSFSVGVAGAARHNLNYPPNIGEPMSSGDLLAGMAAVAAERVH